MNMLLTDYTADILRHLPYLRQALFGPSGINLLTLLPYDVAGYHVINNDGSAADFNRKITQPVGTLKIMPLLIANSDDTQMLNPTRSENRLTTK